MLTRELLEARLTQLVEERQKLLDQLHAYDGALQFGRGLLAEMDHESQSQNAHDDGGA
jgi:hypothetical protein